MNDYSEKIRKESKKKVKKLGYIYNPNLPLLEVNEFKIKNIDSIVSRILILEGLGAVSYGFDRDITYSWLEKENLVNDMFENEKKFIMENNKESDDILLYKTQIEAAYALCWSISIAHELDFGCSCPNNFITLLPNLKEKESSSKFREKAHLISKNEIIKALDLAYCLHWAIVEARVNNKNNKTNVEPYVIIERRRALEWILSYDSDWYDVNLDT